VRRFSGWLAVLVLAATLGTVLGRAGAHVVSKTAALVREHATPHPSVWFADGRATGDASQLVQLLRSAGDDGLEPSEYGLAKIERELREGRDAAAHGDADQLLTAALAAYARDLRVPRSSAGTIYVDPELAPTPPNAAELLASPEPVQHLRHLQDRNPLYSGLRAGLRWYTARWSHLPQITIEAGQPMTIGSTGGRVAQLRRRLGLPSTGSSARLYDETLGHAISEFRQVHGLKPSVDADGAVIEALNLGAAHYERLIALNLDRVRGLPLNERRYLFVDAAGARLLLFEDGRIVDTMRVVVGKPGMETPALAGRIQFAVFQPQWNVPPDLVRNSIAPAVLRQGSAYLADRQFAVFPDLQPSAAELDPSLVDWQAVANGTQEIWVRQRAGADNMMGQVKFMLPNRLGIYLHDTPRKADFARSDRRLSSGCVRVEDAKRLANWLIGSEALRGAGNTPDRHVDLPAPVPVYISYLTAIPEGGKARFQQDAYHRDPAALGDFSPRH
jgi:murein L,D-transpeptidase YcbB/YkuD